MAKLMWQSHMQDNKHYKDDTLAIFKKVLNHKEEEKDEASDEKNAQLENNQVDSFTGVRSGNIVKKRTH